MEGLGERGKVGRGMSGEVMERKREGSRERGEGIDCISLSACIRDSN